MANRAAVSGDISNSTYADWIASEIIPTYRGKAMQVGDVILDVKTSSVAIYYADIDENAAFNNSLTGAASGNDINDTDFVVGSAIDSAHPAVGMFKVFNGTDYDYYKYQSFTGSTFTLDTTLHSGGLLKNYAGSEQVYASLLRFGYSIWVDAVATGIDYADKAGTFISITWATSTNADTAPAWNYSNNRDNEITFFPLRGRLGVRNNPANGACMSFTGIPNLRVHGYTVTYPSLTKIDENVIFVHDTTAIQAIGFSDGTTGNMFGWEPGTNAIEPSIDLIGWLSVGGFAGFRLFRGGGGDEDRLEFRLRLRSCLRLDAEKGEGAYVGTATGGGEPRMTEVDITDNMFIRSAAESFQLQHTIDNTVKKLIGNNYTSSASDYLQPFQSSQTNSNQLVIGDGNYLITKNIFEMWAENAFNVFGTDLGGGAGTLRWKDNLMIKGNQGFFIQSSTEDLLYELINMYFINSINWSEGYPDERRRDYLISDNNGEGTWTMNNIVVDSSQPTPTFEVTSAFATRVSQVDNSLSNPSLIKTGIESGLTTGLYFGRFHNTYTPTQGQPRVILTVTNNGGLAQFNMQGDHGLVTGDSIIINGTGVADYEGYFQNDVNVIDDNSFTVTGIDYDSDATGNAAKPVTYPAGVIVNEVDPVYGMLFYQQTSGSALEIITYSGGPKDDDTNWTEILWDSTGTGSWEAGYSGTPDSATGGIWPPSNFLLSADDPWRLKGYGHTLSPTNRTFYQWQLEQATDVWADVPLSKAREAYFEPEVAGDYRCKITAKNGASTNIYYTTTTSI